MSNKATVMIDKNGISAPSLDEVLSHVQDKYKAIFGDDIYLGSDSQDGQFLGIIADLLDAANTQAVNVYHAFAPSTAEGLGLSLNVKLNGIARKTATYSTVDLDLTGVAGTIIENGVVEDDNNNNWLLPDDVHIGPDGTVTVTATASDSGKIEAPPHSVTTIKTPVRGWQAVTNPHRAAPGLARETDGQLRIRQSESVTKPGQEALASIITSIIDLNGIKRYRAYENATTKADSKGIPPHSIVLVVEGGDSTAIARVIAAKKPPGIPTHGDTQLKVANGTGGITPINFYRPTKKTITVAIDITALDLYTAATGPALENIVPGYLDTIGNKLKQALADYINGLGIGNNVYHARLLVPANLDNADEARTYNINSIKTAEGSNTPDTDDISIGYHELAVTDTDHIELTVHDENA